MDKTGAISSAPHFDRLLGISGGREEFEKGTRCGVEKAILLTKYSWVAGRLSISIANVSNNVLQP